MHWDTALHDASLTSHPKQIRVLFAIIISTCLPSNPQELWNKYKGCMTEDLLVLARNRASDADLLYTLQMYNDALILVEDLCLTIANKALAQLSITVPNRSVIDMLDHELQREQQYDCNECVLSYKLTLPN
uniref:Uncharacterized protein n=1 Tax=Bactrocera dorsalis TaxID=27457 RepID=A0A034VFZ3_BACDO